MEHPYHRAAPLSKRLGVSHELAEIENLVRRQLDAAQEALAIQRRTELILALEEERKPKEPEPRSAPIVPERQRKRDSLGRPNAGRPSAPAASRNLASIQGVSPKTVQRARKRVEKLGTETLERVAGTPLAKPGELDALTKLPEPVREPVSAVAIVQR